MADLNLAPVTVEGTPTPAASAPQAEVRATPTDDPGHVAFVGTDGEVKSIPTANAQKALSAGYRPATEAEYYRAKTGAAGTVMAGLAGAGRGLSLGAYDALTIEAERALHGDKGAEEMRRTLNLLKKGHETASLVGEIGGSLAPMALGLGPAAAAETGGSLLARAGSRAVSALPRAFVEGAAISMGNQFSEDTLGRHELNAQKYLVSGVEGGLIGMLMGAAFAAGGGAITDKLATRAASDAERGAVRAEGRAGSVVGSAAADFAETQAGKALLPPSSIGANEVQKLGKTVEEQQAKLRRIGRTVLDEGIVTAGADKATMAKRVTSRLAEVGEELGTLRGAFEKAAVRPSIENVMTRIQKEVTLPLAEQAFTKDVQAVVSPVVEEIAKRTGTGGAADGSLVFKKPVFDSFDDLFKLRSALDTKLDKMRAFERAGNGPATGHAELRSIRGILEGEFERAADLAAKELGDNTAQKYQVAKALFADLKTAEKWTSKAAAKAAQNRGVSLTDTIAAGHGLTAAATGLAAGHPIAALGLLAGPANKAIRTYGNQVAATISEKAARLMGVQRAAEAYDARLARSVKGFFEGGKTGGKLPSGKSPNVDPDTARMLRTAVKNPTAFGDQVAQAVERTGMTKDAPQIARAMTGVLTRAGSYLAMNMPPEPPPAGFKFGKPAPRSLGPSAQAKQDALIGALDPSSMLADMERGRIDRQKVEALKFINPDMYNDIVQAVNAYGQANQATLTHQQEVAISILTGRPVGAMMQPRTIKGFQQSYASQGPAPEPGAGGGNTKPMGGGGRVDSRAANNLRSRSDRMEADDV